ncbi:MAG: hypothetical protein M5U28_53800 [Sandaracinaceae bacterium]|nr:hypothetical protein [Sandaracinaceae bacterium]
MLPHAMERQAAQEEQLRALPVALERAIEQGQRRPRSQPLEVDAREIAARRDVRRVGLDLPAQRADAAEGAEQHPGIRDPAPQHQEEHDDDEHRRVIDRPVREQDGEVVDPVVAHGALAGVRPAGALPSTGAPRGPAGYGSAA